MFAEEYRVCIVVLFFSLRVMLGFEYCLLFGFVGLCGYCLYVVFVCLLVVWVVCDVV